jgi:hypothetical protein
MRFGEVVTPEGGDGPRVGARDHRLARFARLRVASTATDC